MSRRSKERREKHQEREREPVRSQEIQQPSKKIFLSYARQGGGEAIARELHSYLTTQHTPPFDVWWDREDMVAGDRWIHQIKSAIPEVGVMVLVLTPTAVSSENVRKEWEFALRKRIPVIPVYIDEFSETVDGQTKTYPNLKPDFNKLPKSLRDMHAANLPSFSRLTDLQDTVQFGALVRDLENPPIRDRVPFVAPELGPVITRTALLDELKGKCYDSRSGDPIPGTIVVVGPGGIGKSTLVNELCHQREIRDAYSDGVIYLTIADTEEGVSKEDQEKICIRQIEYIHRQFKPNQEFQFRTLREAEESLKELLEDKDCLIILDDVWASRSIQALMVGGKNCTRIVTTRNQSIASERVFQSKSIKVTELNPEEAINLVLLGIPDSGIYREKARKIATLVANWTLALDLINAYLRRETGTNLDQAFEFVIRQLTTAGIQSFDIQDERNAEKNKAVAVSLGLSLSQLNQSDRSKFELLGATLPGIEIPVQLLQHLWELDENQVVILIKKLREQSLLELQIDSTGNVTGVKVHLYILEYLNQKIKPQISSLSRKLRDFVVENYRFDRGYDRIFYSARMKGASSSEIAERSDRNEGYVKEKWDSGQGYRWGMLSGDGKFLALVSENNRFTIRNRETNKTRAGTFTSQAESPNLKNRLACSDFSFSRIPGGSEMVGVHSPFGITLRFDDKGNVSITKFDRSGTTIAASNRQTILVACVNTDLSHSLVELSLDGNSIREIQMDQFITQMCFSPDFSTVFLGRTDGVIEKRNYTNLSRIAELEVYTENADEILLLDSCGPNEVLVSNGSSVYFCDFTEKRNLLRKVTQKPHFIRVLPGFEPIITTVKWIESRSAFAIGNSEGEITVFSSLQGTNLFQSFSHTRVSKKPIVLVEKIQNQSQLIIVDSTGKEQVVPLEPNNGFGGYLNKYT